MMFVSFEDEHSIFETVFFPEVYERFQYMLADAGVFIIMGTVRDDLGSISIQVHRLIRLSRNPDELEEHGVIATSERRVYTMTIGGW